ncbi:YoaH family protein [Morganella psychrotolerans]|uniref:YoaH family protein n=1 Tax=Morganella psychrotolerans TaxID=368603 RepID=UPI0039AEE27E
MSTGIPVLNHEEQQAAVERIHALMQDGMSSGEAIAQVAAELREQHQGGEQVRVLFDEDDADDYVTDGYATDENATEGYETDNYDAESDDYNNDSDDNSR